MEVEVVAAGLSGTRAGSSEITAPGSASTLGSVRASPSGFLLAPQARRWPGLGRASSFRAVAGTLSAREGAAGARATVSAARRRGSAATSCTVRAEFAPNSGKDRTPARRRPGAPAGRPRPQKAKSAVRLLKVTAFLSSRKAARSRVAQPAPSAGFESPLPLLGTLEGWNPAASRESKAVDEQ